MWKIVLAFVVFAALALFMLSKGGDIDMSGEKHSVETHEPAGSAASSGGVAASATTLTPASTAASGQ